MTKADTYKEVNLNAKATLFTQVQVEMLTYI